MEEDGCILEHHSLKPLLEIDIIVLEEAADIEMYFLDEVVPLIKDGGINENNH